MTRPFTFDWFSLSSDGSFCNFFIKNWFLLILIPVTILIFPYSELIWKSLLRNTCAHHWIFIWHHIVREERNHVSDAIHLILNEKLGVLQNAFQTNSWSTINVASQTSGKSVTKVNLTFVTFSLSNMSHIICDKDFFKNKIWNHSREIKLKDQTGLNVASHIIILYGRLQTFFQISHFFLISTTFAYAMRRWLTISKYAQFTMHTHNYIEFL